MKKIDKSLLDKLCFEALNAKRLRKNLNLHEELSDTLHRFINAMQPGTYVQPHKHENPDKREVFVILQGRAIVVTYTNDGKIEEHFVLDAKNGNYGVEIPAKIWHSIIVLEPDSVVFEVKDGPYEPVSDKNFAPWAPKEGNMECQLYNQQILHSINLSD